VWKSIRCLFLPIIPCLALPFAANPTMRGWTHGILVCVFAAAVGAQTVIITITQHVIGSCSSSPDATSSAARTSETSPVTPQTVTTYPGGTYRFVGCYPRGNDNDGSTTVQQSNLTVTSCANQCAGYTWFGVQSGKIGPEFLLITSIDTVRHGVLLCF